MTLQVMRDGVIVQSIALAQHTAGMHVGSAARAAADGVASLDGSGDLPLAQVPDTLTGKDADTLDGSHAGNEANKIPILDASADLPLAQIPDTLTGKDADTLDGSHAGNEANKIPVLDIDAEIPTAQLPLPFLTLAEYQANTSTGTFSENPQFFNDGDTFYCCSSNAIDQYVEVDFGFPTWIKKFKHCGKSYNNGSGRFKIQGNFNGVWLDIKTDIPTETGWSSWIYLDRPMYTDKVRIVTTTVDSGIGKSVFCDSQLLG